MPLLSQTQTTFRETGHKIQFAIAADYGLDATLISLVDSNQDSHPAGGRRAATIHCVNRQAR